jgi:predicted MFS family arabinose efflux permease
MKNEKLVLFLLAVVQFTHIMDFMIVMPLGAQFMEIFDISPFEFTLIVSSYALAAGIAGFFGAMYIDRFDRKKVLLFVYIGFTFGTLACAAAPSYLILLLSRSLAGAFGGLLGALVLAIVADVVPLERRGLAMGFIMMAFSVASVAGVPIGLYLAAKYSWRMPFISIVSLSIITILLIIRFVPALTKHLENGKKALHPFKVIKNLVEDKNQVLALVFSVILMLGHFTIIPFIAPYMQLNVGFSEFQITYIYLIGGTLTAFLLPYFGKLSDQYGHVKIFTIASVLAVFSIFAITTLPAVPIAIALLATSSFFVVASGRNVPATTMVTSVVKSESRASFMSFRASANQGALFISSLIAGAIIGTNDDGSLTHYPIVGYIAIVMSIVAIIMARKLKLKA